jgi:hypothetical protein
MVLGKKGQGMVDLLITLTVMLFLFLVLFQFVLSPQLDQRVEKELRFEARATAEIVWFAVTDVFIAGPGSNQTIFLPETLKHGVHYNVTVFDEGSVALFYNDRDYNMVLPTKNINETQLDKGEVVVKNVDGVINFE